MWFMAKRSSLASRVLSALDSQDHFPDDPCNHWFKLVKHFLLAGAIDDCYRSYIPRPIVMSGGRTETARLARKLASDLVL